MHELIQGVRRENAKLRNALMFCRECLTQHCDVELWVDTLDKLEKDIPNRDV